MSTQNTTPIVVLDGDDYTTMQDKLNKASDEVIELSQQLLAEKDKRIEVLEARISIMKGIMENFLNSYEGIFDSDEDFFSAEHLQEYLEAATFMQGAFDRTNNRIRQFQEKLNEMPY